MRFLISILFLASLAAVEETRPYRIQADAVNGIIVSVQIYDEVVAKNPVTDAIEGTGTLLPPITITADQAPALFAAVNALFAKSADRLVIRRAEYAAKVAAQEVKP